MRYNEKHRINTGQIDHMHYRASYYADAVQYGKLTAEQAAVKINKLNRAAVIAKEAHEAWRLAMYRRSPSARALRDILAVCSPDYFQGDIDISLSEIMGGFNDFGLVQYVAIVRQCGLDLCYPGCIYPLDMVQHSGMVIKAYWIVQFGKARKVTAEQAAKFLEGQPKYVDQLNRR